MNFTNQIDDELCKNIIENRNILLSSNPIDQANSSDDQMGIDFFSMLDSQSEMSLGDLNRSEPIFNRSNSQPDTTDNDSQKFTSEQLGFNDEIIDSDLFEFLRSEDPEVISLLESLNNSDLVKPVYLPQISVNTTNQVLDHVNNYNQPEQQQLSIFNLTDECLLKQEAHSPPTADESNKQELPAASRVSLRLIKRRKNSNLFTNLLVKPKKEPKRLNGGMLNKQHERKRSIGDDDIDESGSLCSNENSSDNATYKSIDGSIGDDHIYFDDDDDDFSPKRDRINYRALSPEQCENSNEREFQEFVLNYNQQKNNGLENNSNDQLDPTKKDANKEAATRYRLKKLSEKDNIFETRMLMEKENDEIKRRCELVTTEINYLKSLLVQMLLTKGVMSDKFAV